MTPELAYKRQDRLQHHPLGSRVDHTSHSKRPALAAAAKHLERLDITPINFLSHIHPLLLAMHAECMAAVTAHAAAMVVGIVAITLPPLWDEVGLVM